MKIPLLSRDMECTSLLSTGVGGEPSWCWANSEDRELTKPQLQDLANYSCSSVVGNDSMKRIWYTTLRPVLQNLLRVLEGQVMCHPPPPPPFHFIIYFISP